MAELRIENDDRKKAVPSAIYNNLATVGGLRLFACKKDLVLIKPTSVKLLAVDGTAGDPSKIEKRSTITHVGSVVLEGKSIATVTSAKSLEMWDLSKEVLVSSVPFNREEGSTPNLVVAQCTAVGGGGVNGGAPIVATGFSNGEVGFFSVSSELIINPTAVRRVAAHRGASVTAVGMSGSATSPIVMASGDSNGTVVLWDRSMTPAFTIPSRDCATGDCVTGIVADDRFFAVVYGGGKLRLYSTVTGALAVEVAAHARWINAVAVLPSAHHIATCGDDGTVLVWQLPTDANPQIKLLGQKHISNYLWTGVAFAEAGRLYASAYDLDRAYTFSY